MDSLNVLVLHNLGNPDNAPYFLKRHVFSLRTHYPNNNYIYHDVLLPLPEYVKDVKFDAIILDVTLLCARWWPENKFQKLKDSYEFVKYSDAVKLAFPQDEYDCNEILDEWMCDWNVDVIYSVISTHWELLYPKYHKQGKIKLGYTGYIDEALIEMERKPFEHRTIDIGYRTRKLLPYFGIIGDVKWTIGRDVLAACRNKELTLDIVLGEEGFLSGVKWLEFINNCKFTLGSNSGSSLLDPRGRIQEKVKQYMADSPDAEFGEVEENCFKGLDGKYAFTAISPRVMEAALLDSCQILVEGDYSGIIKPWEHYIPIKHDASDFDEVYRAMQDRDLVDKLILNCRSSILEQKELRYSNRCGAVLDVISDLVLKKHVSSNDDEVQKVSIRYESEMPEMYRRYWRRKTNRQKLVKIIDGFPAISRVLRSAHSYVKERI